ncbi:hypothetical protein, partial [Microbacterium laevaniformans]
LSAQDSINGPATKSDARHPQPFTFRAPKVTRIHAPPTHAQLVGNAVLVGGVNSAGHSTDLSPAVSKLLLGSGECNVSTREPDSKRWRSEPDVHEDYLEAIIWATLLQEYAPGLQVRVTPTSDSQSE